MNFDEKLSRYCDLIVRVGVNIQPGEELFISSPISCADVARKLTECAFNAGAKDVTVIYSDELFAKIRMEHASPEVLCDVAPWAIAEREAIVDRRACYIAISSEDPELFSSIDADLMAKVSKIQRARLAKFYDASMSNEIKWCVASAPSPLWAKNLFPDKSEADAVDALWELMFKAMRVYEPDPVEAWTRHNKSLTRYCEFLNDNKFKSLIYKNSVGTNLTVGLPEGYKFQGGAELSAYGCPFTANMPTEEVFSAPHKYTANGTLVASMPLCHMGKLVKNFSLTFENGKVTSFSAESGYDTLKGIIETDEGSAYLGEVALIGYNTPIQQLNTLFLNTLFDENASCHFALGKAYPSCVENTENLSAEELDALGVNTSLEHVDFMVGTKDLDIVGVKEDGTTVQIFKDGNFVI